MMTDQDGSLSRLGRTEVSRVHDLRFEGVIRQHATWRSFCAKLGVLRGLLKLRDVLNHKVFRLGSENCLGVLTPEVISLILDVLLTETGEPLAGGTTNDHVDLWNSLLSQPVLDVANMNQPPSVG